MAITPITCDPAYREQMMRLPPQAFPVDRNHPDYMKEYQGERRQNIVRCADGREFPQLYMPSDCVTQRCSDFVYVEGCK